MFSPRFCGTYFQVFPIFVVPSACVICPPYLHAKLQHLKWSQTNYKRSTLNMHTLVSLMSVRVEMKTAPTIWFLVLTSSTSPYCLYFVAMSSYSYMSNVKLKFTKFIELSTNQPVIARVNIYPDSLQQCLESWALCWYQPTYR